MIINSDKKLIHHPQVIAESKIMTYSMLGMQSSTNVIQMTDSIMACLCLLPQTVKI